LDPRRNFIDFFGIREYFVITTPHAAGEAVGLREGRPFRLTLEKQDPYNAAARISGCSCAIPARRILVMVGVVGTRKRTVLLSAIAAAFALGCAGDDGGGGGSGSSGSSSGESVKGAIEVDLQGTSISVTETGSVLFNTGQADVGATIEQTITVRNVGNGALNVSVAFEYNKPPVVADETSAAPALKISSIRVGGVDATIGESGSGATVGQLVSGLSINPFESEIEIVVQFQRYADTNKRQASLVIVSDTQSVNEQSVTLIVENGDTRPVAQFDPTTLDFGQVKGGESITRAVQVSNTGDDDLLIESIVFSGHPDFRLSWDGQQFEPETGVPIVFDPAVVVAAGKVIQFPVSFTPIMPSPASGKLIFTTNDPVSLEVAVTLQANTSGPAIEVNPKKVQFGGKLVGNKAQLPLEIRSVGTADLVISSISFSEESNANFTLDFTTLPGFADLPGGPSIENPLVIPINANVTLNVAYVPNVENPLGDDGQPVIDVGLITVVSNAFNAELPVEVSGLGVTQECPTAVGLIQEGEQVIPQTNLHLFGDQSFAPAGAVASWVWEVNQPSGSASVFVPSNTFPNPTFEVNTAGEYSFKLDVYDTNGVESCLPWEAKVLVIPDEAIHVELLWHTPNDVDETDQGPEAGSDVDLHFVHDAYAVSGEDLDGDGKPDPWFDQPFDCFWFNAHPNWGSFDPSIDDDPGLDLDDTDGAGPENLNLNIPETTTYRVGVHYWSDHQYGKSLATVRIYIYSNLVFEVQDVELVNHDMWNVATIAWPSGKVELVQTIEGEYKITPNYENPFFLPGS
jgi:hypothetical protein